MANHSITLRLPVYRFAFHRLCRYSSTTRRTAFVEDNLLQRDSQILHHGDVTTVDEEVSPSLENMIVLLTWLRLINTALPKLVKQRYGTELRTRTLSSIKPEISQALDSLLDEITSAEDAKVMRTAAGARSQNRFWPQKQQRRPSNRNCSLCIKTSRSQGHTSFRKRMPPPA